MDANKLSMYVKQKLSDKRFRHTKGVVKTSKELAALYNVDIKSAAVASLLHDIAKEYSEKEFREFCKDNNIELDSYIQNNINLAHGVVGAYIAENDLNIKDKDILNSIKYHTLGRENMSDLEKIIYISDITEEGRENYRGLNALRRISYVDLNKAMALALELNISRLIKQNKKIHPSIFEIKKEYDNYGMEEFMDQRKRIEKISKFAYNVIDSKSSMEVTALNVREITTLADVFLIASAPNTSLVSSIAKEIETKLSDEGYKCAGKEGQNSARWILLDYHGVIIHILHEEEADFYKLDKLWSDGKNIEF